MMKSMLNSPNSSSILEQAVANVIKTAAIEETAFSNILNFENDISKKQKRTPSIWKSLFPSMSRLTT